MTLANMKRTGLWAGIVLTFCSFSVYAKKAQWRVLLIRTKSQAESTKPKVK